MHQLALSVTSFIVVLSSVMISNGDSSSDRLGAFTSGAYFGIESTDLIYDESIFSKWLTSCPLSIHNVCARNKGIVLQMAAIPHTASTSTDNFFLRQNHVAWNSSVAAQERGFVCASPKQIQATCGPLRKSGIEPENASDLLDCVLGKVKYIKKEHKNYNILSGSSLVFTTLRDPAQFVLSQYSMRNTWDRRQWKREYPQNASIAEIPQDEWATKAWWRHNLFTKMLATDTKLIWVLPGQVSPKKTESDEENALGKKSVWLRTALDRLMAMPFFALMHRLPESFELIAFHLCLPHSSQFRKKIPRPVERRVEDAIKKHFVLDKLLLEEAEKLFDGMIEKMKLMKGEGYLCDLSKTLKQPNASLGLLCT